MKKYILLGLSLLPLLSFGQTTLAERVKGMYQYVENIVSQKAAWNAAEASKVTAGISIADPAVAALKDGDKTVSYLYFLSHYPEVKAEKENLGLKVAPDQIVRDDTTSYRQMQWVLREGSDALKKAYIPGNVSEIFGQYDLSYGLQRLKPLIISSFPEGKEKQELLANYKTFEGTAPGRPCPEFSLEDYKHRIHHRSDFDGKYLVIDFWATWCGVCIANLPSYAKLAAQYKDDPRIAFITISIDNPDVFKKWMYSLPRYGLLDLVNLISPDDGSDFATTFHVRGVPRYVIIGPDARIVTAKAPTPHDGLDKIIEKLLNKKN